MELSKSSWKLRTYNYSL